MASISDIQIVLALVSAFVTSILAARLGVALYRS
uniref:Photosystem I reaction center subunit XII n=1 Tax=Salvinia cucullata TaxID=32188 RepID=A0A291R8G9_9MONI|nr:photosystem I protein M [Salvinia cucullata]